MSLGELLQLQWRAPLWWLLTLTPLLLIGIAHLRKPSWQRYADPQLQPWAVRHSNAIEKQTLLRALSEWAFWLLLACALAGPRLPLETLSDQPQQTKHDMDVMIALDVSPSMAATDLAPSRLVRAKLKLQDLMARWHGERIGLIAYSGEAGLLLPLTRDTGAFIPTLELASETLFDDKGSHLAAALNLALRNLSNAQRSRAVLLVTDGETSSLSGEAGNTAIAAARALKAAGVSLYILVSASDAGATLTQDDAPISRPDLAGYRALTEITGGTVALLSDNDSDLGALYQRGILALPASRQASDKSLTWREFYTYPLLAALLLLLGNTLSFTRRAKQALVAAVSLAASGAAQADDAIWREAHHSYRQGQYLVAQHAYHKLNGFHARMGEGASAYRRKDFSFAATQFTQALLLASSAQQRADALFNLGDSYFYAGNRTAAADAFDGVLRIRPNDQRAKENLARVRGTLVLRNAPVPPSAGIPGRRGRGLGEGEATDTTPLDMAPSKDAAQPMVGEAAMDAEAARRLGQSVVANQLDSDASRSAALKKLDLLTDQRLSTLKLSIKQDATREPPQGMPPW